MSTLETSYKPKALVLLHIAVLLFGFTAILGDLIALSALMIVWWRVVITCISLLFLIRFGKDLLIIDKNKILIYLGIGFIIGIHWLCFYGAVKLANASITLICMATTSFFTSLLEPFFTKKIRHDFLDISLGLVMIPCMYLVVKGAHLTSLSGVWVGLLSALLASVFTILNKKHMGDTDTMSLTFLELVGVFIVISAIVPFVSNGDDFRFLPQEYITWFYLLVLALLCTTLAWVLSLKALKFITAFEANLVVNLEPVYGILLAAVLLKEYKNLTPTFYFGATLILIIVISYPWMKRKISR